MTPQSQFRFTLAAAEWLFANDRAPDSVESWDVVKDNYPPDDAKDPVYLAIIPPPIALLELPLSYQIKSMENAFRGDDTSWVFTVGIPPTGVWLVNTKRVAMYDGLQQDGSPTR